MFLKVDKSLFNKGLTPIEILIYSQVEEFNTNTGDCFISDIVLAEQFGVSDRTVSRAIAHLEELGLIERTTTNTKSGKVRHMKANRQNVPCPTDNLSLAQPTKCLYKR